MQKKCFDVDIEQNSGMRKCCMKTFPPSIKGEWINLIFCYVWPCIISPFACDPAIQYL